MTLTFEQGKGILFGIVFGAVNFWLLIRIVRGLVQAEKVAKWKTPLYFIIKIGLLIVTIGLILKNGYVSPLPFLVGFTVSLVAGIGYKALASSSEKTEEKPEISGV